MKQRLIKSVAVLLFSLLPAISFAHDFEVKGIYYKITSSTNKTVQVTYKGVDQYSHSSAYSGSVVIPETVLYEGTTYYVTGIGESAFYYAEGLASVTIPNSVTSIGNYAFSHCELLKSITIPGSVTSLGYSIFDGCFFTRDNFINLSSQPFYNDEGATVYDNSVEKDGLIVQDGVTIVKCRKNVTSVVIPTTITSIGNRAFLGCALSSVNIPNSVTTIGDYAFWGCSLSTINIPNSVTSIGASAFAGCSKLTSISIPSSVTSIGEDVFFNSGITYEIIVNDIYVYAPKDVTAVTIPAGVKTINGGAFHTCLSLSSVSIPESVHYIGKRAFWSCFALKSIYIPSSVVSIGEDAFFDCGLTMAEFASIESLCNIDFDGSFSNPLYKAGHLYINGQEVTNVVIPNGITTLDYTFYGAKYITSVTIPNTVTSIDNAFGSCEKLTSVVIPKGVTSMNGAFGGCTGLQSVTIPNSVVYMNDAFPYCGNLTSVTIPASVKELEAAFINCTKLNSVTNLAATPQNFNVGIFHNIPNSCVLHVLPGSVEAYEANGYWSYWMKTIVGDAVILDFDIVDGADNVFTNASDMNLETITYTRNFNNTNWNALYVPFSMSYDDWSSDFEVARLNDVHQFDDDEDGVVDRTVLESVKLKEGSSTEPNVPYMIKAKEVGEKTITLTDATLYATEENSFDVTSWYTRFNFTGTYHEVTNMATAGHYAMADGGLKQASSDAVTLGAFRWYLDITDRNGNPAPLAAKKIMLSFDDGETTEIEVVNAQSQSGADVYTISGVKVSNDKNALPKGIYIKNGKKVLVK